ncbi:MAG: spermidine synthase, partial [Pseudomonadota bacterium]
LIAAAYAAIALAPLAAVRRGAPGAGHGRRALAVPLGLAALATVALGLAGPFDRQFTAFLQGARLVAQVEGVAATVSVTEDGRGDRILTVNGSLVMGGTATYKLDRIQGHAALLQHPDPRRALFLGIGTGATVAAATAHERLRIEAVDLLPEVVDLLTEFPPVWADLRGAASRLTLHVADARRYVAAGGAGDARYDVILADTYHPARDGAALRYTGEHYRAIRDRLAPGGVAVQWLPLHQLDLETLRAIAASFLAVFPEARLSMGNYNLATPLLALSATAEGGPPRLEQVAGRPMGGDLRRRLVALDYATPFALFGGHIAGPEALAAFAAGAPLNTDDHPHVLYSAPRTVYAPLAPAIERLIALVDRFEPVAAEAVGLDGIEGGAVFAERLERYWEARDAFLRLGAEVRPGPGQPLDVGRLAPGLLAVLEISPDFAPAYEPLLQIARALATRNRDAALALLQTLARTVPRRVEAQELWLELKG